MSRVRNNREWLEKNTTREKDVGLEEERYRSITNSSPVS